MGDVDDLFKVLEPLEHSVLDHAGPAGQHAVVQDVLEPLEHSVLDTIMDGQPMEGAPVLEPIEHSVPEKPLEGGPMEGELIEHSVQNRSRGAPCGRARHRTVWITFVAPVMFCRRLSRPAWRSTSLLGQLHSKCGQIRWRVSTRGFRRMCCCLVTSTCPWCTTTESTSAVFLILHSGGTICHSYALYCRCRQSRRRSGWYRLTPLARVRCVRLGLRRSWIDLLGRPDVPLGVGDWCGLWSCPWRTFRSS